VIAAVEPGRDGAALEAALDATWPAARRLSCGPFELRLGAGGGQRAQAATLTRGPACDADIAAAERAMKAAGQVPLFRLRPQEDALDALLARRGYARHDATRLLCGPVPELGRESVPPVTTFDIWPPLAVMEDIWQDCGIGPDRIAVMARVAGPRTAIFGRQKDRPAGAAFVAIHGGVAMVHALSVRPDLRRRGLARNMCLHAARWAAGFGASRLAAATLVANAPAGALFAGLGLRGTGGYHYRIAPER